MEDATFPDKEFDFITFGAVLEHLAEPAKALDKACAWLKPGGIIHAEVPSSRWAISRILNLIYRLQGTNYVTNLSPMHVPYHLHEFDIGSFEEYCRNRNSEVAHHEYYVCTPYHVPSILRPAFRYLMKQTDTGMQLAVYLRRLS
jgi:SAM-dependent methyltransferase